MSDTDFSQYQSPFTEWEDLIQGGTIPDTGPMPGETIEQLRGRTNAGRVKASETELDSSGLRDRVSWTDYTVPTSDRVRLPIRVYRPKNCPSTVSLPTYVFFHGGGFLLGNIESENANCARVVDMWPQSPGLMVIHISYRHTPEHVYPTPYNDAWDAFEWLSANLDSIGGDSERTVIGGISAGAGLAASVSLRALHERRQKSPNSLIHLKGQLLCIPWLIHPFAHPYAHEEWSAPQQNADAPILPMSRLTHFADLMQVKYPTDPVFNVGLSREEQVRGLPKASVLVAGWDVLRDDGLLYAETLKRAGVDTRVDIFRGLPHGFRRFASLPSSRRWDLLIVDSIAWMLE
ncbi:Alpha/Beta hydrolase protein [Aspergillus cavernicola]|uniref:Alpha/Beta hydrolase protein n=1 Tax=Aspergillus cavernicola TaxID=176166 RepID=A0ABR4J2W6_9EURO